MHPANYLIPAAATQQNVHSYCQARSHYVLCNFVNLYSLSQPTIQALSPDIMPVIEVNIEVIETLLT